MAKTKIEWTETVWNPVTGCSKVSQGCKNCYAETIAKRFWGDRKFTDVICHEDRLEQPLHWKKPRMIFVNSMSDLFHEDVPFEFIDRCFNVMSACDWHTYQVLTKRPERMNEFFGKHNPPSRNVWLGVSVEDQTTADERIPLLLQTPASVRWISAEPLLERINITKYLGKLDWVVVGGESGQSKRPFEIFWAQDLYNQCLGYKKPFFMKQVDKVRPIPEDLKIKEYPNESHS